MKKVNPKFEPYYQINRVKYGYITFYDFSCDQQCPSDLVLSIGVISFLRVNYFL